MSHAVYSRAVTVAKGSGGAPQHVPHFDVVRRLQHELAAQRIAMDQEAARVSVLMADREEGSRTAAQSTEAARLALAAAEKARLEGQREVSRMQEELQQCKKEAHARERDLRAELDTVKHKLARAQEEIRGNQATITDLSRYKGTFAHMEKCK